MVKTVEHTFNGICYKNDKDFREIKDNELVYIGEYELSRLESFDGVEFEVYEALYHELGTTKKQLLDMVEGNELLAMEVLAIADWQHLESVLYEMEDF